MPANKKYLLNTRLGRTSKVLAAIFGSMLASMSFHMALALWTSVEYVVPTSILTFFILWVGFMLMVYWMERPWKSWIILLAIILVSTGAIVLAKL